METCEYIVIKKVVQTTSYLVPATSPEHAEERLLDEKSGPFSYLASHIDVYVTDVSEVGQP